MSDLDVLKGLCKKFIYYLDIEEESDGGRRFRPNYISSCRVLDARAMGDILEKMREIVNE